MKYKNMDKILCLGLARDREGRHAITSTKDDATKMLLYLPVLACSPIAFNKEEKTVTYRLRSPKKPNR